MMNGPDFRKNESAETNRPQIMAANGQFLIRVLFDLFAFSSSSFHILFMIFRSEKYNVWMIPSHIRIELFPGSHYC